MKTENDFSIDEKDFRMWVFDRHNPEDSAIFEPVKAPDKNKLIEQIPKEYTEIRDFISSSNTDKLVQELTETRRQHRKELEQEYIKEKLSAQSNNEIQRDTDDFDIKSTNLREALLKTYENTDAKISFSSSDYSQIKKEKSNRQKKDINNTDSQTDEEKLNSQLKKYKTTNICLISLIFALLIFFVGQRYIERNSDDKLSLIYPLNDNTTVLHETTTTDIIPDTTVPAKQNAETTSNSTEPTTILQETTSRATEPTIQQVTTTENVTEATSSTAMNSLVNINTASAKELQSLEGIGEVKAARIIEYRETYGKFSSTRDILKVSGIGEKTYEKIKDKITAE